MAAFAGRADARTIAFDASFRILRGQTEIAAHTFIAKLTLDVQLKWRVNKSKKKKYRKNSSPPPHDIAAHSLCTDNAFHIRRLALCRAHHMHISYNWLRCSRWRIDHTSVRRNPLCTCTYRQLRRTHQSSRLHCIRMVYTPNGRLALHRAADNNSKCICRN